MIETEPTDDLTTEVDSLLADARTMIGIRTANPPGDELHLAQWLARRTSALGMASEVMPVSEGRANCLASFEFGPGPTIALCTHLDVVPVQDETAWAAEVRDGRLYGRGACDAKGPLAAMLAACARLITRGGELNGRLVLAAVADEETGATGALALTATDFHADAVIIGEPTDNRLVLSSRGALRVAYDFSGATAHASAPERGRNAVHHAARFIVAVEQYHRRLAEAGRASTCAATVVNGGTKLNVIPDHCRVLVDRRLAPAETAEDALLELEALLTQLRDHDADLSWSWSRAGVWLEPFAMPRESAFAVTLLDALGQTAPGPTFPGGTDAPHFIARGIPAAIIGPGSLDQAHSENEWVRLDDLAAAIDIYERAALAFLRPASQPR